MYYLDTNLSLYTSLNEFKDTNIGFKDTNIGFKDTNK